MPFPAAVGRPAAGIPTAPILLMDDLFAAPFRPAFPIEEYPMLPLGCNISSGSTVNTEPSAEPNSPAEPSPGGSDTDWPTEGLRCPHRKSWKRLRAKKKCAFFVCFQCGAKWRTRTTDGTDEAWHPTEVPATM